MADERFVIDQIIPKGKRLVIFDTKGNKFGYHTEGEHGITYPAGFTAAIEDVPTPPTAKPLSESEQAERDLSDTADAIPKILDAVLATVSAATLAAMPADVQEAIAKRTAARAKLAAARKLFPSADQVCRP